MARNFNMIQIDGEKFKRLLLKRGYTLMRASAEIGRSSSYLGNCVHNKEMPYTTACAIESIFNINREEYEVKEKQEKQQEQEKPAEIDYELLAYIVKQAVREAVIEALGE